MQKVILKPLQTRASQAGWVMVDDADDIAVVGCTVADLNSYTFGDGEVGELTVGQTGASPVNNDLVCFYDAATLVFLGVIKNEGTSRCRTVSKRPPGSFLCLTPR